MGASPLPLANGPLKILDDPRRLTLPERRGFVLFVLFVVTVIGAQGFLGPNLHEIGRFLALGEEARIERLLGGILGSLSLACQALGAVLFGYLTDSFRRRSVMLAVLLLSAVSSGSLGLLGLLPGAVPDGCRFSLFLLLRCVGHLGMGAVFSLLISCCGDYFSGPRRPVALGYLIIAHDLGVAAGMVLAGLCGGRPGWHAPFLLHGLVSLALLLLIWRYAAEVRRGAGEAELMQHVLGGAQYSARIGPGDIRRLLALRSNGLLVIQCLLANLPWGVLFTFAVEHLKALLVVSTGKATLVVLLLLAGFPPGNAAGGYLNRRLGQGRPVFLLSALGLCLQAVAFGIAFHLVANAPGSAVWIATFLALGVAGSFCGGISNTTQKLVILAVNPPENRGTLAAMSSVASLAGMAAGTFLFGYFKHLMPSVELAFDAAWLAWILAGSTWLTLVATVRRDRLAMELRLRRRAAGELVR